MIILVSAKRHAVAEPKQQPSKEAVRQWLQNKLEQRRPPADPQQIRRELGWELLRVERGEDKPRRG